MLRAVCIGRPALVPDGSTPRVGSADRRTFAVLRGRHDALVVAHHARAVGEASFGLTTIRVRDRDAETVAGGALAAGSAPDLRGTAEVRALFGQTLEVMTAKALAAIGIFCTTFPLGGFAPDRCSRG